MRPGVFLDRDGTLIEEVGYLNRFERLAFFPWTVDAIRALNAADVAVVVVTNQAGVAHGYYDEAFVRETHRRMDETIRAGGARVEGYYYCPHHPGAKVDAYRQVCECRKPGVGMLRQAATDLAIDLARSYVVGDRWGDVEMARAAGSKSVIVATGYATGREARPVGAALADHLADNLAGAAGWIIAEARRSGGVAPPPARRQQR